MERRRSSESGSLRTGKLPLALLRQLLRYRGASDARVVIGPRFGEDAAVIDLGSQYLVLKSDPVTFTAGDVGWYAVHVNANDVAVMGARPAWFQPTIIVPPASTPAVVRRIMRDIDAAARQLRVAVTGGHTEVSAAVTHPIVAGDMQGVIAKNRLVRSSGARRGDVVLMTKSAGLEGTSILAREFAAESRRLLGAAGQRRAAQLHRQPGISVVTEALMAADHHASAMHDPTEGGVAAALFELASAANIRLVIDADRVPIRPDTTVLCAHFALQPLGLIGSGALLATVAAPHAAQLQRALQARRIQVSVIGHVAAGHGVELRRNGKRVRFEWSPRDELTRLDFGEHSG